MDEINSSCSYCTNQYVVDTNFDFGTQAAVFLAIEHYLIITVNGSQTALAIEMNTSFLEKPYKTRATMDT